MRNSVISEPNVIPPKTVSEIGCIEREPSPGKNAIGASEMTVVSVDMRIGRRRFRAAWTHASSSAYPRFLSRFV